MAQSPYPQSDRALVRLIERSPGHRAGYKQLVRELSLGGGKERRLLLEQLARLTARGELVSLNREHWGVPKPAAARESGTRETGARGATTRGNPTRENLIAGRLDLHRD